MGEESERGLVIKELRARLNKLGTAGTTPGCDEMSERVREEKNGGWETDGKGTTDVSRDLCGVLLHKVTGLSYLRGYQG